MSIKLPQRCFVVEMPHKYSVGDKVRVNGAKGVIHALMPYTFVAPAYYVRIGGSVVAVSERSLERVEIIHPNGSTIDES